MTELPPPDTAPVTQRVLLKAGDYEDCVYVDITTATQLVIYSSHMINHVVDCLHTTMRRSLALGAVIGALATVVAYLLGQVIF